MNYKEFEKKLKELEITKHEFSNLLEINHTTITKWKKKNNIPKYAELFLGYLIEMQKFCNKLKKIKGKSED